MDNSSLQLTDQNLIDQIIKGEVHQFDVLVTRHRNTVFRFILKQINDPARAEDLAQDTFVSAYQNIQTYQGQAKFLTWLLGIARNKILNEINRAGKKRAKMVSDEVLFKYPSKEDTPLELVEKKQILNTLQEAIGQLGQDLQEVLISVSMEGLSYEDVSEMMSIPVGTVKSKLYRARMLLKDKMAKITSRSA